METKNPHPENETGPDSDILSIISPDLVSLPVIKEPGITEVDFDGLLERPLRLKEDLKEGCGGQVWPAGMVLGKYVLRKRESIRGKSVVELGAGGGLVGLALALALSNQKSELQTPIHLTDQLPMLSLMQSNIALNNLSPTNVQASIYDWGTPVPSSIPNPPDIILAADCVYFEPAFPLLLQTLQDLMGEETVCYFCFKKRRRADLGFVKSARKVFKVEDVEDDPEKGVWGREGLFLYRITRKK